MSKAGVERIDGVLCDRIAIHTKASYQGEILDYNLTYDIGQADHLVRRETWRASPDGNKFEAVLKGIDVHSAINPKVYKYKPPVGVIGETESERKVRLLLRTQQNQKS